MLGRLDQLLDAIIEWGRWLALPVMGLLFLQWPLRDLVQAGSREANDVGQWLFALYVAVALTAATRARTHLAADALARRYPDTVRRRLALAGSLLLLAPWAAYLLWRSVPIAWTSLGQLERFPETLDPGYFLIKIAACLLALLVLLQVLADLLRAGRGSRP